MIEIFNQFMTENPHYGYLIAAGGFGFYLLGLILNWKWTLEPGGGYFTVVDWIEAVGEKTVRIVLGTVMIAAIIGCVGVFLYYDSLPH